MEAIKLIFTDSFCELIGVIISSLLACFLALSTTKPIELDHWSYMISSGLVPICLSFFFHVKSVGCYGGDNVDLDEVVVDDKRHQFPAVVIYHTIVSICFLCMGSTMLCIFFAHIISLFLVGDIGFLLYEEWNETM